MPAPLLAPRVPTVGRCWRSDRAPGRSDHPGREAGGPTALPGGQISPGTEAASQTATPGDQTARPIIGRLPDICRALHGTRDSAGASHDSGIPALRASPSSYAGATGPASTSAVATSEGYTGGTSG
jgi:hypothetical protein